MQNHISETSSYNLFCSHFDEVLSNYPNLAVKGNLNNKFIKGILDIPNSNGEIVGSFFIEIHYPKNYPFRFPILYEIGDIIPKKPDWHKGTDSSCCINVEPDEILLCKTGITILEFIDTHAIAFFANYLYRISKGFYKNGEYGHDSTGLKQFYSDLLKTTEFKIWINYFEFVFRNRPFDDERNNLCFCGSGVKFKKCHKKIFTNLFDIGESQVISHFKKIIQ